ncbi:MAG: NADH-quinone oxidoreductase subunit N [Bryobacteraceae bacterium]
MNAMDLLALLPLLLIAATSVVVMLAIAIRRSHTLAAGLTALGLGAAFASLFVAAPRTPRDVTPLLSIDLSALFYTGLILAGSTTVVFLCYGYFKHRENDRPEEMYVLIAIATLGSATLVSASHFASFFLGLEILSVSLYGLISYERELKISIEAGLKYLVLAAASASFLLFGMALVYFELGTMEFGEIAAAAARPGVALSVLAVGFVLVLVGIGFKLALVPFHMWTPDVYEGAPAPVTAFVATVSKGAMFALLLRYFNQSGARNNSALLLVLSIIAVASMFAGNLLALLQNNVKRILAYSSIAHLGYLIVAFEASGDIAGFAVAFYLVAYFATMLGAFGVVTMLSTPGNDRGDLGLYRGLFWRRPVIAGVFTVMLLSLAGIPLTAGFVGKFYVVAAGASALLWLLVFSLVITSAIGLFYYLRVVVALYSHTEDLVAPGIPMEPRGVWSLTWTVGVLTAAIVAIGCYPSPVLRLIQNMIARSQ